MRIAIPVAEGRLAMHFGHCQEFTLVDADTSAKRVLETTTVPAPEHEPGHVRSASRIRGQRHQLAVNPLVRIGGARLRGR